MTDVAIVTTTINYPEEALKKYASVGQLVVVGDLNTPPETADLVRGLNGVYLTPDDQEGWKCSDAIGWRCIQRRNIGFLEGYRLGADVVITIDDDNAPEDPKRWLHDHLANLKMPVTNALTHTSGWFNPGSMLSPHVHARGYPYLPKTDEIHEYGVANINARVGVNCGLWLGDPDIDALQRITRAPETKSFKGQRHALIHPEIWSPINSQNTAWRRSLLPLTLLPPHIGRWDDILGGYIAQWSMWGSGYVVSYGEPLVYQERNEHNLWTDLKKEIDGLEYTIPFCTRLLNFVPTGDSLSDLEMIADILKIYADCYPAWPIADVINFIHCWIEDWEEIL